MGLGFGVRGFVFGKGVRGCAKCRSHFEGLLDP